jgi:rRNA-processing protein FCF1
LLNFSTICEEGKMATVNFSVPEEVKASFNEVFSQQNKSAVIAELMLEAVERARSRQRSRDAISNILGRRDEAPVLSDAAFRQAREAGRS